MTKIRILRAWEKQEEKRVESLERQRKEYYKYPTSITFQLPSSRVDTTSNVVTVRYNNLTEQTIWMIPHYGVRENLEGILDRIKEVLLEQLKD